MSNNNSEILEKNIQMILKIMEEVNSLKDVDAMLDRILFEARKLANADAGSIFLMEDDDTLKFSYVQNDTLFKANESNAEIYANYSVLINHQSIVGHTAITGKSQIIDDAYNMEDDLLFTFDGSYDQESGYHTTSIFSIPLKTFENRLVGVMQLINAKDEKGHSIPFTKESQIYVPIFANSAAIALERGLMNRELVLRMMKMAELKDPTETGAHVQRVGAFSAEIYQRWALNKGIGDKEIKRTKDMLRLAAMLHDVGKVGVSDLILKKPGKLTDDEFGIMKFHTVDGAKLFVHTNSELDRMSYEIALNHHEKWNGGGYPGMIDDIFIDPVSLGPSKKGLDIPLAARITALADVFDALASRRSYKDPWPDEKILSILKQDRGNHFDPDVVDAFLQIFDVIKAIQSKFQ